MENSNQIPAPVKQKFNELFETAHAHTLELLKNIIAYEKNMTNLVTAELNDKMQEAIFSAKNEIEFATFAGIPLERMSTLAQSLYADPSLSPQKEFKITSKESVVRTHDIYVNDNTKFVVKEVEVEDGIAEIFMPEEAPNTAAPVADEGEIFVSASAQATPTPPSPTTTDKLGTDTTLIPAERKPHSNKRREWIPLVSMLVEDECEIKIEVARLTELDSKRLAKAAIEKALEKEQEKTQPQDYFYNLS